MTSDLLAEYIGVPVVIQLKKPIAGIFVKSKEKSPHFEDPEASYWVPQPAASKEGAVELTQLLQMATITEVDRQMGVIEIQWLSILQSPLAIIATIIDLENIDAVTRVVSVTEPPEPSRIITG
jgi:hypothetical protein